jgi:hypothetical protein
MADTPDNNKLVTAPVDAHATTQRMECPDADDKTGGAFVAGGGIHHCSIKDESGSLACDNGMTPLATGHCTYNSTSDTKEGFWLAAKTGEGYFMTPSCCPMDGVN